MGCWCGYLSGARCRLFAYGPADATAVPKPQHLCLIKIQTDFTLLEPAYPGCPGKEAVNKGVRFLWCVHNDIDMRDLSWYQRTPLFCFVSVGYQVKHETRPLITGYSYCFVSPSLF